MTFAVGGENSRFEKFGDDHNKILGREDINWSVPSRVVGEQKDVCRFDMEIM